MQGVRTYSKLISKRTYSDSVHENNINSSPEVRPPWPSARPPHPAKPPSSPPGRRRKRNVWVTLGQGWVGLRLGIPKMLAVHRSRLNASKPRHHDECSNLDRQQRQQQMANNRKPSIQTGGGGKVCQCVTAFPRKYFLYAFNVRRRSNIYFQQ